MEFNIDNFICFQIELSKNPDNNWLDIFCRSRDYGGDNSESTAMDKKRVTELRNFLNKCLEEMG